MDPAEFAEWAMLLGIEPWGGARADCLNAMLQGAMLAPWTRTKIKVNDLIPRWGEGKSTGDFGAMAAAFLSKAKGVANGG